MDFQEIGRVEQAQIIGRPTLLAIYQGRPEANDVLQALGTTGYPLDDVSVLLRLEGSDQVLDLATGAVAAGQSVTAEELQHQKVQGNTVVLMHPAPAQLEGVQRALESLGPVEMEYAGETFAYGQSGEVVREDKQAD